MPRPDATRGTPWNWMHLLPKCGRLDGVAYAYIQDPKGEIIATSLQPFPAELKESGSTADQLKHE